MEYCPICASTMTVNDMTSTTEKPTCSAQNCSDGLPSNYKDFNYIPTSFTQSNDILDQLSHLEMGYQDQRKTILNIKKICSTTNRI